MNWLHEHLIYIGFYLLGSLGCCLGAAYMTYETKKEYRGDKRQGWKDVSQDDVIMCLLASLTPPYAMMGYIAYACAVGTLVAETAYLLFVGPVKLGSYILNMENKKDLWKALALSLPIVCLLLLWWI